MPNASVFPAPPHAHGLLAQAGRCAPGLALAGALALAAQACAQLPWLRNHGVGALTLAIMLGMLAGNALPAAPLAEGTALARQHLLRLGIVLWGLRLSFQDIARVGLAGAAIDATMLASTFALACFLGTRVFGLERRVSMLIGAGSAICGAAAVLATAPVVRGRDEEVTVAVSTVVVFGTLALFLYPALYRWNAQGHGVALSAVAYGVYAGSTIHELAQVVAAGHAIGATAADTAVIVKMVRVMMLAPFLLGLSAWLARAHVAPAPARQGARGRIALPWFAFGFVALAGVHSSGLLPAGVLEPADALANVLLAIAMAALGLGSRLAPLRAAGLRPLALAAVLFAWLVVVGAAVNLALGAWLGAA